MGKRIVVVDRVDERGTVVGAVPRALVLDSGVNFRVAHLFLYNEAGELLVQKIAPGLRHPGMWGSSAATYVRAGEDYKRAIARAAAEEIGVEGRFLPMGETSMSDGRGRKFIALFKKRYDLRQRPLTINGAKVAGVEFLSTTEIANMMKARTREFTPTFLHLFKGVLAAQKGRRV